MNYQIRILVVKLTSNLLTPIITEINAAFFKSKTDKCVENEEIIECNDFHGYKSIKASSELKSLIGFTADRFVLLLSFLTSVHGNAQLNIEDQ